MDTLERYRATIEKYRAEIEADKEIEEIDLSSMEDLDLSCLDEFEIDLEAIEDLDLASLEAFEEGGN